MYFESQIPVFLWRNLCIFSPISLFWETWNPKSQFFSSSLPPWVQGPSFDWERCTSWILNPVFSFGTFVHLGSQIVGFWGESCAPSVPSRIFRNLCMSQSLVKSPILVFLRKLVQLDWDVFSWEARAPWATKLYFCCGKAHVAVREILTTLAVGASLAKINCIAAYYLYITEIVFALIPVKRISNLIKYITELVSELIL